MNKNLKRTFSVIIVILGIIILMPTIVTMADTTLHTWGKTLTRGVWESVNDDGISKKYYIKCIFIIHWWQQLFKYYECNSLFLSYRKWYI